jgi:hypothetical protein
MRKRRSNPDASKKLDCFANARNDVLPDTRSPSRSANDARGFARKSAPPSSEGARNAGRQRTRSLACKIKSTRVSHHRFTGKHRHSLRNGFNGLLRALPGEPGLLSPYPAQCKALSRVNASVGASGPHGFAVRQTPRTPCEGISVHRSLPRGRGDREPPLLVGQDGASA